MVLKSVIICKPFRNVNNTVSTAYLFEVSLMFPNTYRFQDSRMNGLTRVVLYNSVLRYISMIKCMYQFCLQDIQKLAPLSLAKPKPLKRKHTIQGPHSLPVLTIMYLMKEAM